MSTAELLSTRRRESLAVVRRSPLRRRRGSGRAGWRRRRPAADAEGLRRAAGRLRARRARFPDRVQATLAAAGAALGEHEVRRKVMPTPEADSFVEMFDRDRPQVQARPRSAHPAHVVTVRLTAAEPACGTARSGSPRDRTARDTFDASFTELSPGTCGEFVDSSVRGRPQRKATPSDPPDRVIPARAPSFAPARITNHERGFGRSRQLRADSRLTA